MSGELTGKQTAVAFTPAQLLSSKRYTAGEKDVLRVMLVPGMTYSHNRIVKMLNEFMNKEAK